MKLTKAFKGWRRVLSYEIIKKGDVFVEFDYGKYISDPTTGSPARTSIGGTIKDHVRDWENYRFHIYRRTDMVEPVRRLKLSHGYSKPLPLP